MKEHQQNFVSLFEPPIQKPTAENPSVFTIAFRTSNRFGDQTPKNDSWLYEQVNSLEGGIEVTFSEKFSSFHLTAMILSEKLILTTRKSSFP